MEVSAASILADKVVRLLDKIAEPFFLNNFEFWRIGEDRLLVAVPLRLFLRGRPRRGFLARGLRCRV